MTTRVQVTVPPQVAYVVRVTQSDWTDKGWIDNANLIMHGGEDQVFHIHDTRRLIIEELPTGSEDND